MAHSTKIMMREAMKRTGKAQADPCDSPLMLAWITRTIVRVKKP